MCKLLLQVVLCKHDAKTQHCFYPEVSCCFCFLFFFAHLVSKFSVFYFFVCLLVYFSDFPVLVVPSLTPCWRLHTFPSGSERRQSTTRSVTVRWDGARILQLICPLFSQLHRVILFHRLLEVSRDTPSSCPPKKWRRRLKPWPSGPPNSSQVHNSDGIGYRLATLGLSWLELA